MDRTDKSVIKIKRVGKVKVSAVFCNVKGIDSFVDAGELDNIKNHSFVYLSETMKSKPKFINPMPNPHKSCHVVHAVKPAKRGRPERGQMMFIANRFSASVFHKDEHCIVIRMHEYFICGLYIRESFEYDEKVKVLCDILESIYKACSEPQILLAGDLNVNPSKNDNGELELMEEIMLEYNISIKSNRNIPTCFNNNYRGFSTNDYVLTSHNFSNHLKIEYLNTHAGSDHIAFRVTFKLDRKVFKEDYKAPVRQRFDSKKAERGLMELLEKIPSSSAEVVANDLQAILSSCAYKQKVSRPKFKHRKWFNETLRVLKSRCMEAWKVVKGNDSQSNVTNYLIAKKAYKSALGLAKKQFDSMQMEKFIEEHNSISKLFKTFRKTNSSNAPIDMMDRLFSFCKVNYKADEAPDTFHEHECEYCKMPFKTRAGLKEHIGMVHAQEKHFSKSQQEGEQTEHLKAVHSKIKLYECEDCDYTSDSENDLASHVNMVHQLIIRPFSTDEIEEALKGCDSRAKGVNGYSQFDLKGIKSTIVPALKVIFNNALIEKSFPSEFLKNHVIFIHKGGEMDDPINYRMISIQNPILKLFMSILQTRLLEKLESNGSLPDTQFGFRSNRSTLSACFTLNKLIQNKFKEGKKLFCLFVDYKRAFASIKRKLLYEKMNSMGMSRGFIQLIAEIYKDTKLFIRGSDGSLSKEFATRIGLPEGCAASTVLFSVFIADIGSFLPQSGVPLKDDADNSYIVKYLAYADDMAILSDDEGSFRESLIDLEKYCKANCLLLNVVKTKIIIFSRGRPKIYDPFHLNNEEVKIVKTFKYLGIIFSVGGSFNEHVKAQVTKATSRIGYLYGKLNLRNLNLELIKKVFAVYVDPIITYGLAIWYDGLGKNSLLMINAVWTKFLKIWLGIPMASINSFVHHYTNSIPLSVWFNETLFDKFWHKIQLPHLKGMIFNKKDLKGKDLKPSFEEIPSYMWMNRISYRPPTEKNLRKKLLWRYLVGSIVIYAATKNFMSLTFTEMVLAHMTILMITGS